MATPRCWVSLSPTSDPDRAARESQRADARTATQRHNQWPGRTPSPATAEFKKAQLECEARKGIRPNRVLISDITADATGELFLYVNDAVLTLPGLVNVFYLNNSGTAKVTVEQILAEPIEPNN